MNIEAEQRARKCEFECVHNKGYDNINVGHHEMCEAGHCVLCYQMRDAYTEDCVDFQPKTGVERKVKVYEKALETIIDVAYDYDGGADNPKELRDLIDELRQIANEALSGKSPTYIKGEKVYNCFDEEVGDIDWNSYKITYHDPNRSDF